MAEDSPRERPGPADLSSRTMRDEARKAFVWLGMALLIVGVIVLAQPIMLILGGMLFAVILDGGTRLLGRILPIARWMRLTIVILAGFGFIAWVFYFAGTTLIQQAEAFRIVITEQWSKLMAYLDAIGVLPQGDISGLGNQLLGGIGRLTSAVSTALGIISSAVAVLVIGIFIAIEPKLYDRGFAWMLPMERRASFYEISDHVSFVLRRLMMGRMIAMVVEGVGTWLMLWAGGVPMAALLGLLTGLLAFIPNIGAIISGVLMAAVGFSAGIDAGLWAILTYFVVQTVDGNIIMPYVARRTVDLAPAVVLAAQLIFGALFGFLGLLLADPIVATIKTALQDLSARKAPQPAPPARKRK